MFSLFLIGAVAANDTLNGKLLADIAYGYGVVPILHQKADHYQAKLMPLDDTRLNTGDRLVVVATIEGLQRVEQGTTTAKQWLVRVEKANSQDAAFEGASIICRVADCDLQSARTLMTQLPAILPCPLYQHQAYRLVSELSKAQVTASVEK